MEEKKPKIERRKDATHLYFWMGETTQSIKDINKNVKNHMEDQKEDIKNIVTQIGDIRSTISKSIACPYKEDIEEVKTEVNKTKGERKYIYGGFLLLWGALGALVKKIFHHL